MAFDALKHMSELVWNNIDGGLLFGHPHDVITLPNGQEIAPAVVGHPETITYWMQGADGTFHQITEDQEFAENLWLNFAYGESMSYSHTALQALGLDHVYHVNADALLAAIAQTPVLHDALAAREYSDAAVLAYVADQAPGVLIVGQP
jgi:hypothetical protein